MPAETIWEVPEPLAAREVRLDDDTVTVVRRHGNPDAGLRLILSHGNGLAIDLYYPFWSLLADDFDLVMFDLRNHGWNSVGRRRDHNVPVLMHDHDLVLDAVEREYGAKPSVGVFHSLSTLVAILAFRSAYSGLVLFDPPLCKPVGALQELDEAAERAAAMTRRRGYRFRTEAEFAELLSYLPAFARVLPGVRELMAATTLRRAADGDGFELRCPREYEAQIMDYVRSFAPLLDLTLLSCPTKVVGADPTLEYAYLPTFDLSHMMTVDYDFLPEATHFLQLEKPADCVAILRTFLEENGLV